jgi:hypothetical protein
MECKKCTKIIAEDSKFCEFCGAKVEQEKKEEKQEQKVDMETPKIISDVRNHIEFMGYELNDSQVDDNGILRFLAIHKNRPNLFISYFSSGNALLITANYTISKVDSEPKKQKLLEVANHINNNLAIISAFSVGADFNIICFSTWYPDVYSKKEFSNFLETFENEISRLSGYEGLQEFFK